MHKVRSCGVIVFRSQPEPAFLLLRHQRRYDLPKGHMNPGETELECALRELSEETSIEQRALALDSGFRCEQVYYPRYQRYGGEVVEKTLVLFLGYLLKEQPIRPTEHIGYEWIAWRPPHRIQQQSIDPLLKQLETYFGAAGPRQP